MATRMTWLIAKVHRLSLLPLPLLLLLLLPLLLLLRVAAVMVAVLGSDSSRSRSSVTNVSLSFISNVLFTVKFRLLHTFWLFSFFFFFFFFCSYYWWGMFFWISCFLPPQEKEKRVHFCSAVPNDWPVGWLGGGCRSLPSSSHVSFFFPFLFLISFPVHPLFLVLASLFNLKKNLPSSGAKIFLHRALVRKYNNK